MIKKLQKRFIRIALIALTVAMVLVAAVVNLANWISVRRELDETLAFLSENEGMEADFRGGAGSRLMGKNKHTRNLVSESSWFSVYLDENGEIQRMFLDNMTEADAETAAALAGEAAGSGREYGFLQDYLYQVRRRADGRMSIVFLNCETKITSVRTLGWISLAACAGGILLAWLIVSLASRKAVEPTIRNMEQQKQFITNASHELKTPLTVISTNMELLQMEHPDSPWVKSTQRQTVQMRHLVDELVYLSRLEEENAPLVMEAISLAPMLRETAEPFQAMAEFQGKNMTVETEGELTVRGDRASLQRLFSTLLDNAVKYAPAEGSILVSARAEGRYVLVKAANDVSRPLTEEQCRQLFDRFYRADPSRNKEKQNGFGIGLAIAAAIVEKHGGSISAAMEGGRLVFECRLPRQ